MTIDGAFNASIEYYDDWMRKALPNYGDLFQTALEVIPFETAKPIEVLDLGAGTGLFSEHILEKYPGARFLLYDVADKMLDVAREDSAGIRSSSNSRSATTGRCKFRAISIS